MLLLIYTLHKLYSILMLDAILYTILHNAPRGGRNHLPCLCIMLAAGCMVGALCLSVLHYEWCLCLLACLLAGLLACEPLRTLALRLLALACLFLHACS